MMPAFNNKKVSFSPTDSLMLDDEEFDYHDRITFMEKKMDSQADEIACLKSAVAEVLRRMNSLEAKSYAASHSISGATVSRSKALYTVNSPLGQSLNQSLRKSTPSIYHTLNHNNSSYSNPSPVHLTKVNADLMKRNNKYSSPTSSLASSLARTGSLPPVKRRAWHPGGQAIAVNREPQYYIGHVQPSAPLEKRKVNSAPSSPTGTLNRKSSNKKTSSVVVMRNKENKVERHARPISFPSHSNGVYKDKSLHSNNSSGYQSQNSVEKPKEPEFYKDEGILKCQVGNHPVTVYCPTNAIDSFNLETKAPRPIEELKLEWVYGYRGKDCRCNIHFLPTGEAVYFVASVLVLYNIEEQTQRHYTAHTAEVKSMAVHPDRITIASGQGTGVDKTASSAHVRVWDSVSLHTLHIIGGTSFEGSICCLAFSVADAGCLLAAVDESTDHILSLWNWSKEQKITESKTTVVPVVSIEFHPTNDSSLVTFGRSHIYFWTISGIHLSRKPGLFDKFEKPKYILCGTFDEMGNLITGDSSGNILKWDRGQSKAHSGIMKAHIGPVFALCLTKFGTLISGGGKDGCLIEWDTNLLRRLNPSKMTQLNEEVGPVRSITRGPGDMLLVGTTRNCILQGTLNMSFATLVWSHKEELWAVACHPDLPQFLTAGTDKMVALWDTQTRQLLWSKPLSYPIQSAAFYPASGHHSVTPAAPLSNGELSHESIVVLGTKVGRWIVLDCNTREFICAHSDGGESIECIQFSSDGSQLVLGSHDYSLYIYRVLENGRRYSKIGRCMGHSNPVVRLDWSVNGQHLRSMAADKMIIIWQAATCKQIPAVESNDIKWSSDNCPFNFNAIGACVDTHHNRAVLSCCRANSKAILACGDSLSKVRLYRYPACHLKSDHHLYLGHGSHVTSLQFLSDDSRLISIGGSDLAIMQWEVI